MGGTILFAHAAVLLLATFVSLRYVLLPVDFSLACAPSRRTSVPTVRFGQARRLPYERIRNREKCRCPTHMLRLRPVVQSTRKFARQVPRASPTARWWRRHWRTGTRCSRPRRCRTAWPTIPRSTSRSRRSCGTGCGGCGSGLPDGLQERLLRVCGLDSGDRCLRCDV